MCLSLKAVLFIPFSIGFAIFYPSWSCNWVLFFVAAEDGENDDSKKEKIMTATKKGGAVLDQWLADEIKTQYHILQLVRIVNVHSFG